MFECAYVWTELNAFTFTACKGAGLNPDIQLTLLHLPAHFQDQVTLLKKKGRKNELDKEENSEDKYSETNAQIWLKY